MVNEAEKYAEEDEIAKGKIAAKNSFESYIFNVKNHLDDEKLKVGGVTDSVVDGVAGGAAR